MAPLKICDARREKGTSIFIGEKRKTLGVFLMDLMRFHLNLKGFEFWVVTRCITYLVIRTFVYLLNPKKNFGFKFWAVTRCITYFVTRIFVCSLDTLIVFFVISILLKGKES